MATGSSSVCPRHEAELQLMPHGSVCRIPSWTMGAAPPGPAPSGSPPGRVPSGVERSLTPLCCDEDPGHTMSSRGLAAPSKAEQV